MADVTEVANALVALIAGKMYPNGTAQPSITGGPIKVFQGLPLQQRIASDLTDGTVEISVVDTKAVQILTRYGTQWNELSVTSPTMSAIPGTTSIVFNGPVSSPMVVALLVDHKPYTYAIQTGDTLTSIATALATLINTDQTASSTGAVLTVPGAHTISPRFVTPGTLYREVDREARAFLITVWANCFDKRDPVAKILRPFLSGNLRLPLPDGTVGIMTILNSWQDDSAQQQGIYRRDFLYRVEYPTIETDTDWTVGIQLVNTSSGPTMSAQGAVTAHYS